MYENIMLTFYVFKIGGEGRGGEEFQKSLFSTFHQLVLVGLWVKELAIFPLLVINQSFSAGNLIDSSYKCHKVCWSYCNFCFLYFLFLEWLVSECFSYIFLPNSLLVLLQGALSRGSCPLSGSKGNPLSIYPLFLFI